MTLSPEMTLLLACIRHALDLAHDREVVDCAARIKDWRRFLDLAEDHCLLPLAADCLSRAGADAPADVSAVLDRALSRNVRRVLLLSSELVRISRLLERRGVSVIALKGPAVAHTCYADPAHRTIGDLDLLVRAADIGRAAEALERDGYRESGDDHLRACRRAFRRWNNELPLEHETTRICIDLHWDLAETGFPANLSLEGLRDRSIDVNIGPGPVRTPAPEDHLRFLCLHGFKHDWSSLHWVVDICGLVRRQSPPRISPEYSTWIGLMLADRASDARIPEFAELCRNAPESARIAASEYWNHLVQPAGGRQSLGERVALLYRMSGSPASWAKFLLAQLTIPREADWVSARIPWRPLFFLYYPWRLLRLAWKWRRIVSPVSSRSSESA